MSRDDDAPDGRSRSPEGPTADDGAGVRWHLVTGILSTLPYAVFAYLLTTADQYQGAVMITSLIYSVVLMLAYLFYL